MRKNILLFSILLTLFFVGIKRVSASACEYSLADITTYQVINNNGSVEVRSSRNNTTVTSDTKLIMTINDTFVQGSQNISWSVSDSSFTVDNPTNFQVSKDSTSVESGYEGEQINYYKTCPKLRILFSKESNIYHIKNIVFTTDSNSQLNTEGATLTSVLSDPWPSWIRIGSVYQYDFTTNSAYSTPRDNRGNNEQGSYCDNHPEDPKCASNSGGKPENPVKDDGTFEFCDSKGVLTTFNIVHKILTIARIIVPLIIIIMASIAFFKAVVSNDEKALSKAVKDTIFSLIISLIIFLIPSIVYSIVDLAKGDDDSFKKCQICFTGKDGNCDTLILNSKNK